MLRHQDLIPQHIEGYSEATHINPQTRVMGSTVYNAAGIESFHASPPNISAQRPFRDHRFPTRSLSLINTALQIKSFIISFRKTAVEAEYRAPLATGIIRE
jgi:hypothetical protein